MITKLIFQPLDYFLSNLNIITMQKINYQNASGGYYNKNNGKKIKTLFFEKV